MRPDNYALRDPKGKSGVFARRHDVLARDHRQRRPNQRRTAEPSRPSELSDAAAAVRSISRPAPRSVGCRLCSDGALRANRARRLGYPGRQNVDMTVSLDLNDTGPQFNEYDLADLNQRLAERGFEWVPAYFPRGIISKDRRELRLANISGGGPPQGRLLRYRA
jgi:hypothetical protein